MNFSNNFPLISVIIPTYNYAKYLPRAIESVLFQTYTNFEIIIIDDGSTDNTKSVLKSHPAIRYFYQENKGLAAARNAGIKKSNGTYLVFLDADDWLEVDALEQNFMVINQHPDVAFVSGNYYFLRAESNKAEEIVVSVSSHHYLCLLKSNYIGMHAAVMFQKWIFREFEYDETLKACEDYDLYLCITKKHSVIHHQKFIATYFFHSSSLSHNYKVMMNSILAVITKQALFIKSPEEKLAYEIGLEQCKEYIFLEKKDSLL